MLLGGENAVDKVGSHFLPHPARCRPPQQNVSHSGGARTLGAAKLAFLFLLLVAGVWFPSATFFATTFTARRSDLPGPSPPSPLSYYLAIMTVDRGQSYLCLTLRSVLRDAVGARHVIVFHSRPSGDPANEPPFPPPTSAASAAAVDADCAADMARVEHVRVPKGSSRLDFYAAVVASLHRRATADAAAEARPRGLLRRLLPAWLLPAADPPPSTFCNAIVLEDDVILSRNFDKALGAAIEYIAGRLAAGAGAGWPQASGQWSTHERPRGPPARGLPPRRSASGELEPSGAPFVLSLYQGNCCDSFRNLTARAAKAAAVRRSQLQGGKEVSADLRPIPPGGVDDWWSWGTPGMLFHGLPLLAHLDEAFAAERASEPRFEHLQDIFIQQFATANNYSMWAARPSFLQHVGVHSSLFGKNSRFHLAMEFADDADGVLRSLGHPGWDALGE